MMNRIDITFDRLKNEGRRGLVGFLTVGDPDLVQSEKDIRTALDAGVDVLELGVPFSDPTADGPTIQAASQRALKSGCTLKDVLLLVRRIRDDYETPIVLFGYANLLFHYGYELICKRYNHSNPAVTMRYLGIEDKEVTELLMNEIG